MIFSDITDVINKTQMFMSLKFGGHRSLADFPVIAQNRWQWIVENWSAIKPKFQQAAGGSLTDLADLDSFEYEIISYKLGNKSNPLVSRAGFLKYQGFLSTITLGELSLSPEEIKNKDEQLLQIASMSEQDFRDAISALQKYIFLFECEVGLGDVEAGLVYGYTPIPKKRSASIQDMDQINSLYSIKDLIEGIVYDFSVTNQKPPNLLAAANNNLDPNSGVSINDVYKTYIAIPFEISLEHMAKKFLGSEEMWYELVTVNNLQPPYIDEVGTKFPLLAPASFNSVIFSADMGSALVPGTRIGVGSYKIKEKQLIIKNVSIDSETNTAIVYLESENLNYLKPSEGAFARVYKPHTARKNSFILIPSEASGFQQATKPTPKSEKIRQLHRAFIQFGVDVYRDEYTGDWLFESNGNFKKAAGMKAIRQAVLNSIKTTEGELPFHPSYGVPEVIGERYGGRFDEAALIGNLFRQAIQSDSRFQSAIINSLTVTDSGAAAQFAVKINGFETPIPLSFVSK